MEKTDLPHFTLYKISKHLTSLEPDFINSLLGYEKLKDKLFRKIVKVFKMSVETESNACYLKRQKPKENLNFTGTNNLVIVFIYNALNQIDVILLQLLAIVQKCVFELFKVDHARVVHV